MELSSISAQVLFESAKKKNIDVEIISRKFNLFKLSLNNKFLFIKSTSFPVNPQPSCIIANNKYLTKKILIKCNIPTPKSWLITNIIDAKKLSNNLEIYPCVLKPVWGSHGNKVFPNIKNQKEFSKLLPYIFTNSSMLNVLVEEYIIGKDYRCLVVKDKVVGVVERVPAHVIGNGHNSIAQLIKAFNKSPLVGIKYEKPMCKIVLDHEVKRCLKLIGKTFLYIPLLDEVIFLRQNANISTGGVSIDVTDGVSEVVKNCAIEASNALGMVISGVDIIFNAETETPYILEVNDTPGIDIHHFPTYGNGRKVSDEIIDCLIEELN